MIPDEKQTLRREAMGDLRALLDLVGAYCERQKTKIEPVPPRDLFLPLI